MRDFEDFVMRLTGEETIKLFKTLLPLLSITDIIQALLDELSEEDLNELAAWFDEGKEE